MTRSDVASCLTDGKESSTDSEPIAMLRRTSSIIWMYRGRLSERLMMIGNAETLCMSVLIHACASGQVLNDPD